ncbi:MAG: DUF1003 domain-containing protein [Bacilli bacterium]
MAKTKKEIVKMIVNKDLQTDDEEILVDLLLEQPISIDVDKQDENTAKFKDKLADKITEVAGSWTFILCSVMFIIVWVILNALILTNGFDKYPFILLNLFLSCIAALQAPVIMMSQNRQADKDRLRGQNDYKVDLKSELILEDLHEKMEMIIKKQRELEKLIKNIQ